MNLRDYQQDGTNHAITWAATAKPSDRLLLASPTGTGKSFVILALLESLPGWIALVPSLEIAAGMLGKIGVQPATTDDGIALQAAQHRIYTPIRFKNALLYEGAKSPLGIIEDEGHHDTAQTHQDVDTLCNVPKIATTGTPYRGTPQSTAEFLARWGEPRWLITLPNAAKAGHIALPTMETWPLVDDDEVSVQGGELVASQIESRTRDKLQDLLDRCAKFFDSTGRPTRPTVFAFPGSATSAVAMEQMQARGWKTCCITQGTPRLLRNEILRRAADGSHALLNVRVIGEGVDLPLRRYIDCSPTLSPVLWMQRLGRILRQRGYCVACAGKGIIEIRETPDVDGVCPVCHGSNLEPPPEYIVTNNNLQRHFYLLDGACPAVYLTQSVAAFGKLTARAGHRAFGLQGMGKLKPIECLLTSGITVHCYSISQTVGASQTQFFVVVHPLYPKPIWASRGNVRNGETLDWGRWSVCTPPAELCGFRSLPTNPLSPKQAHWWETTAERHGLAEREPTAKLFPVLPVLSQLRLKLS